MGVHIRPFLFYFSHFFSLMHRDIIKLADLNEIVWKLFYVSTIICANANFWLRHGKIKRVLDISILKITFFRNKSIFIKLIMFSRLAHSIWHVKRTSTRSSPIVLYEFLFFYIFFMYSSIFHLYCILSICII